MKIRSLLGVAFGAVLVGTASVASAAPITIQYLVTLNERCTFQDGDGSATCVAINEQFLLALTFDDGVTDTITGGDPGVADTAMTLLGAPTFTSTVSLMPVTDPIGGGGPPSAAVAGIDQESLFSRGESVAANTQSSSEEIFNDGNVALSRQWIHEISLTSTREILGPQDAVVTPPTPTEIIQRLNGSLGTIDFFLLSAAYELTCQLDAEGFCPNGGVYDFAEGSASVSGTAVVVTPQTVPEPATIGLLGIGLLASRLRRRSRRA